MRFSYRSIHGLIVVVCLSALAIAYWYMEQHLGLPPCPLCIIDRLLLAAIAAVALSAWLHDPGRCGQRIYALSHVLFSVVGTAVVARHIHLQNLPAGQVPDCIPDLDYMLETFSWLETLTMIFNTSGECAQVQWTFAGLSIPEQTLLLFVVLAAGGAAVLIKSGKPLKGVV